MNYCQFRNDFIKRMANAGGGLPAEYQAVEYLQSSGTQYIDTGVVITANDIRIVTKLNALSRINNDDRYFGSQGGADNYCTVVPWINWRSTSQGPFSYLGVGSTFELGSYTTSWGTDYDIDINASNGVITGDYCGYAINNTYSGTVVNGRSIYIFANNASDIKYCNARFFKFEIYSNGEQKFNGIPCYHKADNKPGMYDLVTNTFFTNAGTGEFTIGNNV